MRAALPFVCLLTTAAAAVGQLPSDGRTSYARETRIRIPFELRTDGPASSVKLFVSHDGGAWQEYDTARAGQKREFIFTAERDGPYGFATMTLFKDGTSDPPHKSQLTEQRRVVVDRTAPKVLSVRSSVNADGAPGIEWDVTDDNPDPKGIRLMYRWSDGPRFVPIDAGVPFSARDNRHWQLRPDDRMQVKVVATDRAGNKTESDPVWVSAKDGRRGGDPARDPRPNGAGTSAVRDAEVAPAGGGGARVQAPLHYLNSRTVTLNSNVTTGPSGIQAAYLYWADDKLAWRKWTQEIGPKTPAEGNADKPRPIPLQFVFTAEKDGLFNFIIISKNHNGVSFREPRTGDNGHVQVMVDTLKPEVTILGTKVAANGDRGAAVNITWQAKDANIAAVPIKIDYKAVRSEEWKAVTPDWIDNTGQHTWTPPAGEAHEFILRVTCKDRAGNETVVAAKEPVNVDLAVPQVEYGDVAPGKGGGGGAFREPPPIGIPEIGVTGGIPAMPEPPPGAKKG